MNTSHTPATVAAPIGPFCHGVEVSRGSRMIYTTGEAGVRPDGEAPPTIEAQAEWCWRNIEAVLTHAGFQMKDLVKITTFLTHPDQVVAAGKVRAKHLGDIRPASTTVIVSHLVRPEWLIEIEAVAAQT